MIDRGPVMRFQEEVKGVGFGEFQQETLPPPELVQQFKLKQGTDATIA